MAEDANNSKAELVEGEDYYLENGLMVFTARYHLRRGYCCDSGCRHCPYQSEARPGGLFKRILGQKESEQCGSCGEPFVCGASLKGCWCAEVKLTEATRQILRSKFRNCLCRDCLEKLKPAANNQTL